MKSLLLCFAGLLLAVHHVCAQAPDLLPAPETAAAAPPVQVAVPVNGKAAVNFFQSVDVVPRQIEGQPALPAVRIAEAAKVKVPRKWNEKQATIRVPFENTSRAELKIEGVQTTGSLYVVSFPSSVPVGGKDEIVVIYRAGTGSDADLDVVKLATNQGEKTIEVAQERESVVVIETRQVQWIVGAPARTQTVFIAVDENSTVPKSVRALGDGHKAELKEVGKNRYRVDITPASTDRSGQFPVLIEFEPELTGVAGVIHCSILPRE